MDQILFPGWRNTQYFSRYPFVDSATLVNSQNISISNELFDDAVIHPVGGAAGAFIGNITVVGRTITFSIYDPVNGLTCSGSYTFGSSDTVQPGLIRLLDIYNRPAGVLVSDHNRLEALVGIYGAGSYDFERTQTEFVAACVIPIPNSGVRGFLLDDGSVIGGDVWLVGENGVVLSMDGGKIRVDVVGDPYAGIKDCKEVVPAGYPTFCGVRSLNEIVPDTKGDFKLTLGGNSSRDSVLRIEQEGSIIKVKVVGTKDLEP